eukprot:3795921-Rhodomonas_salina.3
MRRSDADRGLSQPLSEQASERAQTPEEERWEVRTRRICRGRAAGPRRSQWSRCCAQKCLPPDTLCAVSSNSLPRRLHGYPDGDAKVNSSARVASDGAFGAA